MAKSRLLLCAWLFAGCVTLVVLAGCGGGGSGLIYFNVSERSSWSGDGRMAFASFGGNGLLYIYRAQDTGGESVLLTPSDNDDDLNDEGGWHPAYSPDDTLVAFASRRGPSTAIWTMDAENGDRENLNQVTDDSSLGADEQPSWSPDGSTIIYTSTRRNGNPDTRTIGADGTGMVQRLNTDEDEQWASYKPTDANYIVFQRADYAGEDNNDDVDVFIYNLGTTTYTILADSPYVDGAPAWRPDGAYVAFHSDRSGDYDIWVVKISDGSLTHVTSDARSDGYPVWNSDGTRIAFTRDRELWSVQFNEGSAGTDEERVTRRYR